ncbi:MAG: ATP-binding protein [Pseudomonadota bacterium]
MLLFAGFTLVALPLMLALVHNAISVNRIASQSHESVSQAVEASQLSRQLVDNITAMERLAQQYFIINDQGELDSYQLVRTKFQQTVQKFSTLPIKEGQRKLLEDITAKEKLITTMLLDPVSTSQQVSVVTTEFPSLLKLAQALMSHSNDMIEDEAAALERMGQEAQRIVFWQLLGLIPVALLLVAGFTVLIVRPIRELDQAIRRLGNAEFKSQITVRGPEDIVYLARRLNWLRLRLMELEEQKGKFLRHVSHELKTPLTALREGSELLAEEVAGPLNPQQREIVRILRDNSVQLRKLIEDLLNYSAVQYQKTKLETRPLNLGTVVKRVAEEQKLAMLRKNLSLETDCQDFLINGDEEKLRVVIDNLLSNAIKFSPLDGKIQISLWQENGFGILDIVDSGPGVAPEDRDRIFDAFYQGQAIASGPVKGTGLGLSIVKEIVLAHHGRIEIINDPGRGAHFRITLPLGHEDGKT